jgi:hypothetical protein
MPSRKLSLRLRPQGQAYSRLSLSGVIPTTPSAQDLRLFCYLLSLWQGSPLDVVLSADARVSWVTAWTDALAFVREDHLRVRFVLDGGRRDR